MWRNVQVDWESSFNLCVVEAFCREVSGLSKWHTKFINGVEVESEYVWPEH